MKRTVTVLTTVASLAVAVGTAAAPPGGPMPPQPSHGPGGPTGPVPAPPPAPAPLVEDIPDMSSQDIQQVLDWIRTQATGIRLPFCWRQSSTRGVGKVPGRVADCPSGYTNNGATCGRGADTIPMPSQLASCPSGYTNMGLTCFQGASTYGKGCTTIFHKYDCRSGYTDDGCFCGRGASTLSSDHMTCPSGFTKSSLDERCIGSCPSGFTNTGETCFRGVDTLGMGSMTCNSGEVKRGARCYPSGADCGNEDEDAGLCYPKCAAGFSGAGPVCWQQCDPSWVSCGAGCGRTATTCASTVSSQVLAPLVVAANIATMGLAAPVTEAASAGVETMTVAGKTLSSSTNTGKALIGAIKALQSVQPEKLAQGASITRRIFAARTGTALTTTTTLVQITVAAYTAEDNYAKAYASDFVNQTSVAIGAAIDNNFTAKTAEFLKETWGRQELAEMAVANNWNIAQTALSAASLIDITGVSGVVQAYAQPICQSVVPFPCVAANAGTPACGNH